MKTPEQILSLTGDELIRELDNLFSMTPELPKHIFTKRRNAGIAKKKRKRIFKVTAYPVTIIDEFPKFLNDFMQKNNSQ